MRESAIVREILIDLGNEPDFRLFRNNTGALADVNGRLVRYGLAPGSADIIGILAPSGRMVAFEVKTFDKRSKQSDEQIAWGNVIRQMGGMYQVVRTKEEARLWLDRARQGLT